MADIPSPNASLDELIVFAHTFDGYKAWGSFEKCAAIANARDHSTLDALRTCLFFEARRWRHMGDDPDPDAKAYWHDLLTKMRAQLAATLGHE
jgi:hypothetical protein